jgi:hypothetical protein
LARKPSSVQGHQGKPRGRAVPSAKAVDFFRKYAGYAVRSSESKARAKTRGAQALARAEAEAEAETGRSAGAVDHVMQRRLPR